MYYFKQIEYLISTLTQSILLLYKNLLYKNLILHNLLKSFFKK